ncbi:MULTISPECIES: hypothetical protein [Streptomyces]
MAHFTANVAVRKAMLRRWMPMARLVFRLNDRWAVRAGLRALTNPAQ